MKIKKIAHAEPPRYPSLAEAAASPERLRNIPRRWNGAFTTLAGLGLAGAVATTVGPGRADEAPPQPVTSQDGIKAKDDAETLAAAQSNVVKVATVVAPILQKALDRDGRGSFGCMCVDPPTYLSENEALNLIADEFAKAGLPMSDCLPVDGFDIAPNAGLTPDRWELEAQKEIEEQQKSGGSSAFDPKTPKPQRIDRWVFDLASGDGSVAVEFLSKDNYDRLLPSLFGGGSSVSSYNLALLAQNLHAEYASRTNGMPMTVGVFFDPMTRRGLNIVSGKLDDNSPFTMAELKEHEEDWKWQSDRLKAVNRARLREQVQFFIRHLQEKGKLPNAPDAAPHESV